MTRDMDLSVEERDDFLGSGGTGVLALASGSDEAPHALPVSYGYDPEIPQLYFRLATGPSHQKGRVTDRAATFVTYALSDSRWTSVIAQGNLEKTTRESIAIETLAGLERVDIPFVDIFGAPPQEVTFTFVRLAPETISARTETPTD